MDTRAVRRAAVLAAAAPATVIPRGLEVYAGWGGETAVASVEIQRNFYALPFERTRPIPGYAVDAAKLFVAGTVVVIDLAVWRARDTRRKPTGITVLVGSEQAAGGSSDQYRATVAGPGTVSLELR